MTSFKNIKLKVLSLPNFFYFYRQLMGKDTPIAECVGAYSGYIHELRPIIGRDGWYYDRVNNFAWFEIEGRAFVDLAPEDFVYELKMLNHKPLTKAEKMAILTLVHYNNCPKSLKELMYVDECFLMCQQVYRAGSKDMLRLN